MQNKKIEMYLHYISIYSTIKIFYYVLVIKGIQNFNDKTK